MGNSGCVNLETLIEVIKILAIKVQMIAMLNVTAVDTKLTVVVGNYTKILNKNKYEDIIIVEETSIISRHCSTFLAIKSGSDS